MDIQTEIALMTNFLGKVIKNKYNDEGRFIASTR